MKLNKLIETVSSYGGSSEVKSVLTKASQIASVAHNGYKRINGEPFLSHSLAVAGTLAEWHAPLPVVAVGLLHDILSLDYSNGYNIGDVRSALGSDIVHILEAVINLNSFIRDIESSFDEGVDVINIQHYIASALQQERDVVVIKIADRLHNLQTISALTRFFQERAARIGFNLFAPMADRLGMGAVKRQLEDYCFEIFNPTPYKVLKELYADSNFHNEIQGVLEELKHAFSKRGLESEVRWQPASLYTLYYHQIEQNAKLGRSIRADPPPLRMVDAGSFIITADQEIDCYLVLGTLHKLYSPLERQFRDFIGQSKENAYRSLHTQVKQSSGNLLPIIIRTHSMDLVAERGITARWWNVPEELLPQLPKEVKPVDEEMQVFSPNGMIKYLPKGATVLDFAYSIHTDLGHRCVGALVNGEQADQYRILKTGDRIEIISGAVDIGPSLDWLDHVRTSQAISHIRQWLTLYQRNAMVERGRTLLDRELQPTGMNSSDAHVRQLLLVLAAKEGLDGIEDLLISIGVGRHKASKLVEQLKSMRLKFVRSPNYGELNFNVNVLSPEDALLSLAFARCCRPVPTDDIVGYQRNDHTLVIHKRACARIKELEKPIPVKWDTTPTEPNYVVVVEALNRPGLASDLSTIMALSAFDMTSFSAYKRADGVMAEAHIYLNKTTSMQRTRIQKELESMPYVTKVEIIPTSLFSTSVQQPMPSRSIYQPNPYGPTVAAGSRFYGREAECQRISVFLRDQSQNTTILLWGQKRIGKTSLVLRLQEQSQGDFLPVYIDVQGLKDGNTYQFLYQLMSRISLAHKEIPPDLAQEISVPALNRLRKDPLSYFDTFMDLVQKVTRNHPLVIILDEFQCLCSLREEVISRSAIFSRLRSYSQHGQGIRFIMSGGGLRSQLTGQCDMASLFNIAYDERLGCLEVKDARQLIEDGLTNVGSITERTIELLLDLTASHPFYLQLLCSMLYGQAQENKTSITHTAASQGISEWLDKADNSRFQHLWEGHDVMSALRNKLILSAIAELTTNNQDVEYDRLAGAICSVVPEHILVQSLDDLADLGVLEHYRASYLIKIELFAHWLRQHWPLKLTLKETC